MGFSLKVITIVIWLYAISVNSLSLFAVTIDKLNSYIGFEIHQFGLGTVKGEFKDYEIETNLNDSTIVSLNVIINVASIQTGNKTRDRHLQSKQFFYVDKHPYITFELTQPIAISKNTSIKGNLAIKGNPIYVELPASFINRVADTKQLFTVEINDFTLDRTAYGMKTYKKLINKFVDTDIQISVLK